MPSLWEFIPWYHFCKNVVSELFMYGRKLRLLRCCIRHACLFHDLDFSLLSFRFISFPYQGFLFIFRSFLFFHRLDVASLSETKTDRTLFFMAFAPARHSLSLVELWACFPLPPSFLFSYFMKSHRRHFTGSFPLPSWFIISLLTCGRQAYFLLALLIIYMQCAAYCVYATISGLTLYIMQKEEATYLRAVQVKWMSLIASFHNASDIAEKCHTHRWHQTSIPLVKVI